MVAPKGKILAELPDSSYREQHGIFIPSKDTSREFLRRGNVRTIDETYTNHIREGVVTNSSVPEAAVGDRVVFNRHNGEEFIYKGKRYISIDAAHITKHVTTNGQ